MLSQTTSLKARDRDGAGESAQPVVWARSADNVGFPEGLRARAIARAARTAALRAVTSAVEPAAVAA
jgi:hypothetical protein